MEREAVEGKVDPKIFTWTVKIGTAIITFMAGIMVYMHRKLHDMDKALAVNEEKDAHREKVLTEVKTSVTNMETKLNTAIDMFHKQQTNHNKIEIERKELAGLVKDQKSVIEYFKDIVKMN